MAAKSAAGLLTSVDSMFTTQEERDNAQRSYVIDLPAAEISDFPDHPFKVRMDEEMEQMVESVKERGVLSPVLVRPMPDGSYQMVSGHRRKRAAELAGLPTLPCIVRELTDDEAIIIMVDSNLQRERVLPSEKAFAYKMKLDAMKRQGQRRDLTSSPVGTKLGMRSNQELAEQSPDSKTQIHRYICLTNLVPELLDMHFGLNGKSTMGFCAEKGKGMGWSLEGQTWGSPQPITDPTVTTMMAYFYAHSTGNFTDQAHALGVDDVWDSGYTWTMNAWVQAIVWRYKAGLLSDPVTACAEELLCVYNNLEHTSIKWSGERGLLKDSPKSQIRSVSGNGYDPAARHPRRAALRL